MPPPKVKTIRDLIYWEYSNIIAKSAGIEKNYRFIVSRFKKLKAGEIKMSDILRDDKKMILEDKCCTYCGCKENHSFDHIIPEIKGGPDMTSNLVLACKSCNSSKGDKDIFYWYGLEKMEEIPKLVFDQIQAIHQDCIKEGYSLSTPRVA